MRMMTTSTKVEAGQIQLTWVLSSLPQVTMQENSPMSVPKSQAKKHQDLKWCTPTIRKMT